MIARIDHLVFTVNDVDKTCDFYRKCLGVEVETFGEGRKRLCCGEQKINLHQRGREFEPKARTPVPGAQDLCFESLTPVEEIRRHLERSGALIELGPVERIGAKGPMRSIYFRDPDGNLIEIAHYQEDSKAPAKG